jgi:short chain dehydrogenase
MSREQWQRAAHVKLGSMFNVWRQVIEGMHKRNGGPIVNISSINGHKGQFGQVNYAATKAGIIGFTRALTVEGAQVPPEVLKAVIAGIPVGRLGPRPTSPTPWSFWPRTRKGGSPPCRQWRPVPELSHAPCHSLRAGHVVPGPGHIQFRISGRSWPWVAMYCLCSISLSLSCCLR